MEVEIKISDYLNKEMILDVQNINKEMALNKLIDCIITNPAIKNSKEFRQAIYAREALMSTGIGYGIAIPHARLASVSDIAICILRCVNGIEYPSIDDLPVKIIFMIAAAENQSEEYIRLLSHIILVLKNEITIQKLYNAKSVEEIYNIFC